MLLKFSYTQESPRVVLKLQVLRQQIQSGAWASALLTCSPGLPLVQRAPLEDEELMRHFPFLPRPHSLYKAFSDDVVSVIRSNNQAALVEEDKKFQSGGQWEPLHSQWPAALYKTLQIASSLTMNRKVVGPVLSELWHGHVYNQLPDRGLVKNRSGSGAQKIKYLGWDQMLTW